MSLFGFMKDRNNGEIIHDENAVYEDSEGLNGKYDIEIIIDDDINAFNYEKEQIYKGALEIFKSGAVDSLEEAILTYASDSFNYKCHTTKNENGKIIMYFKSNDVKKVLR